MNTTYNTIYLDTENAQSINNLRSPEDQSINNKIRKQTYTQISQIGEGSYGKAYLVKCSGDDSLAVIKSMNLESLSDESKKEAYKESKILEKLEHPNIVRFIEVFKSNRPFSTLNIVMEYADGGDLNKAIKHQIKENAYFEESKILNWFCQICLAVKHIHGHKIIHRDLKSGNIFLTKSGIVKIGDFGIAKSLSGTMDKAKTVIGTPYYLSPEIIMNKPYSFKSDIWALGVLLYEMTMLKVPFDAKGHHVLYFKVLKGEYNKVSDNFSKELQDLIKVLLTVDQKLRPDINEILSK